MQVLFAKPMPTLSCKMNALATALTCEWLMGPMKINDVEIDSGQVCCMREQLAQLTHSCRIIRL